MPRTHRANRRHRTPSYRLHKATGQAYVELNRRRHCLGNFDLPETREKYHRLIAEWEAGGRRPLNGWHADGPRRPGVPADLTIAELVQRHWQHAQQHYLKPDGTPGSEPDNYRQALRPVLKLYGDLQAADFGPLALKAVRQDMIKRDWCRKHINKQVHRICAVFRWAASEELLSASVYNQLKTVEPLRKKRSRARESNRVRPVPEAHIEAIKPFVSAQVWAMIQLQLLSGLRPDEVTRLTRRIIDSSADVWVAKLEEHKTAHHAEGDDGKMIFFGPRAQKILAPYLLDRSPDEFLFSPVEAEESRRAQLHARRVTPASCGNTPGSNRKAKPRRSPASRYTTGSYRRAIHRACDHAFPLPPELARGRVEGEKGTRWETRNEWMGRLGPENWAAAVAWLKSHRWSPHRLRHNAGTSLRRTFGIEVAQTVLGHQLGSRITEIYAEENIRRAIEAVSVAG